MKTDPFMHITNYITGRLEDLDGLLYHHEVDIPEPDAAEQREYSEARGERLALRKIAEMLAEPSIQQEDITAVMVTSGFGHNTQQPFVQMLIQRADWTTRMSPDTARELAFNLLKSADDAESDGFLINFLRSRVGMEDMRAIATILVEFREYREQRRYGSGEERI
ncbi:MAG TPA: hypothetical protein PKA43_00265 [Candidatus Competibacter phosphatis]|nr:hypothetical protein [Candidatus Competibacter phosphatis]